MNMTTSGTKLSKRVEKELHQNKVVVRRLPPDFTEEKFKEFISPFPNYAYFCFSPGDHTLGTLGCSRAYIAFENEHEIVPFRDQYDGVLLESEKGGKFRAIVEFAPYQGVPKKAKRKPDARCGTIDKDPDFQAFMQSLETQPEPRPSVKLETYLEEQEANRIQDVQVTPLIMYLRDRMSGRGGRSRGRADVKKKRKGELSSGKSKSYKSSKGGSGADAAESSTSKSSKSREYSSKGKKEKKESESISRSGSSTKMSSSAQEDKEPQSKNEAANRSSSESRQERKEKYRGGGSISERKEGGGKEADASGEKESRRGKQRNRDRPDRSFYVPRSRDQDGGGGGGGRGGERESKESSRDSYSRGGRGKQGRYDDSNDYGGGRPRSRGRGRGYRRNSDQHGSGYQDK